MSSAITGDLSADMPDGTRLTDSTDLGLAWQVAEHMTGESWGTMTHTERYAEVSAILAELRAAYAASGS